jgi:segregation and condensation protein B
MDDQEAKNSIEAALFVAGGALGIDELASTLDIHKKEVVRLIETLIEEYRQRSGSVEIVPTMDNKYVMQLKPEYTRNAVRFAPSSGESKAILKTLSIIAYKQPISQSDIVRWRGTSCYRHIKILEDRGFVERKPRGRSYMLSTTTKFAETYGLRSKELDYIKEFILEHSQGKNPRATEQ